MQLWATPCAIPSPSIRSFCPSGSLSAVWSTSCHDEKKNPSRRRRAFEFGRSSSIPAPFWPNPRTKIRIYLNRQKQRSCKHFPAPTKYDFVVGAFQFRLIFGRARLRFRMCQWRSDHSINEWQVLEVIICERIFKFRQKMWLQWDKLLGAAFEVFISYIVIVHYFCWATYMKMSI